MKIEKQTILIVSLNFVLFLLTVLRYASVFGLVVTLGAENTISLSVDAPESDLYITSVGTLTVALKPSAVSSDSPIDIQKQTAKAASYHSENRFSAGSYVHDQKIKQVLLVVILGTLLLELVLLLVLHSVMHNDLLRLYGTFVSKKLSSFPLFAASISWLHRLFETFVASAIFLFVICILSRDRGSKSSNEIQLETSSPVLFDKVNTLSLPIPGPFSQTFSVDVQTIYNATVDVQGSKLFDTNFAVVNTGTKVRTLVIYAGLLFAFGILGKLVMFFVSWKIEKFKCISAYKSSWKEPPSEGSEIEIFSPTSQAALNPSPTTVKMT
jgi:hypothetical protein